MNTDTVNQKNEKTESQNESGLMELLSIEDLEGVVGGVEGGANASINGGLANADFQTSSLIQVTGSSFSNSLLVK